MMLVPRAFQRESIKHFSIGSGLATLGSNSFAAGGTGVTFIPVYAWHSASAVASMTYYNGTGGSAIFTIRTQLGGTWDFSHWEEPNQMLPNKCPVLESNAGIGGHEFHVYALVVRGGAGAGGTVQ